jgi:glycosyltransferase involved in cell wall biosynthesis
MPIVLEREQTLAAPNRYDDSRRHILYLIDVLWGLGGAEQALLRTAQLLPTDRYRLTVGTFRLRPGLAMKSGFGCPVIEFPLGRVTGSSVLKTAARLAQFIRRERVDLVHTFFETSDLLGGLVAKLSGRPVISSRRDMGFLRTRRSQYGYRLLGFLFDEVHTVSEAVRQEMISRDRLDPKRVVTIPNGIPFGPAPVRVPREGSSPVVLSVGNIRGIKGTDVLIRTAQRVVAQNPDVRFWIAGSDHDERYAREMRALVTELGLARHVRFLGKVEDITPLLDAADVFCLLSRSEGMSNALLEAMAAAVPCVATAVGGTPEVLTGELSTLLVPSGDADLAALKILQLLSNPAQAQRLGRVARARVEENFTARRMVQNLAVRYGQLLALKK